MLRKSTPRVGSYIVSQRVLADWWQPFYREDLHQKARRRVEILQTPARADAQRFQEGEVVDSSHQNGGREDSVQSGFHTSARPRGDGGSLPSLYEINALVATFTNQHNAEGLSAVLQYMREVLDEELAPYHYHSLLRVFSYNRDKENAEQLLAVMAQRGETTLETYARVMDCLHCLAPDDVLHRMLRVMKFAQDAYGTLVFTEVVGSEGATVAAYGTGDEWRAAIANSHVLPGDDDDSGFKTAPVLSSLLHHVSNSGTYSPIASFLVALWIRAVGVQLSDWDYVCLLSCFLVRSAEFPHVRALFGCFSDFPAGTVSPDAVFSRLEDRGECRAAPMSLLVEAMRDSLRTAQIDTSAPVAVGVINTQSSGLSGTLDKILAYACRFHGLGPHKYNTAVLYHTLTLLHATMGSNTEAANMLLRAADAQRRLLNTLSVSGHECDSSEASPTSSTMLTDSGGGEPFSIGCHYLLDVGGLLPRLGSRTLHDLSGVYIQLAQEIASATTAAQEQVLASSTFNPDEAHATVVQGLAGPVRLPTSVDVLSCEAYTMSFIRTNEEAREALRRAVAHVVPTNNRIPRGTRLLFKQFAEFCCRHPRRNCKLTPTGLAERRKWGAYLDARDTSLALFGSARQARDSMKHLFYHNNQLPALRNAAMIERDIIDVSSIFFPHLLQSGRPVTEVVSHSLLQRRTTLPHVRCGTEDVPRYLWDPAVYNPYPHVQLRLSPVEEDPITDDFFADLWLTVMNPAVMGNDVWYVQNTDMYIALMRCLIHRLDWEAAVQLTTKMLAHSTYTYLMDHELTTIFKEVGDPSGCLAFKVAAKLFDGRIMRDGQTKRDTFHSEGLQRTDDNDVSE